MSALSDRMAGMTRKQAHELNDREAINEFDRLAAEREREDAPPLKERQASWGETREELIALRAELSALKARRCDGCVHATPIPMQYRTPGPERWYWCGNAAKNGDDWGTFTTDGPFVVAASHSCAAWTEKP